MQVKYTSLRCSNRGPHKVNTRSYIGPFVPPVIAPAPVPSSSSPVSSVEVSLPWYVRLWNWIKHFINRAFAF